MEAANLQLPGPDQLFRELRATANSSEDHARKIRLATLAFETESYKLPRKAHFLLEWVLDRLLKTRTEASLATPILDHEAWLLLQSLLSSEQARRELKQTLIRIPVLPTLASFLARYPSVVGQEKHEELLQSVYACYNVMLPLCVSGSNTDAILNCVSSFLASSSKVAFTEAWLQMSQLLLDTAKSLPTDKNTQKKLSTLLLEQSFPDFLAAFSKEAENGATSSTSSAKEALSDLSSYLLFSSGNLQRIFSQPIAGVDGATKCLQEIFTALSKATKNATTAPLVIRYIPDLFATYCAALQANASELFAQRGATTSSRSAAETHVQQQLRHAVFGFLRGSLGVLSSQAPEAGASCISGMLTFLEEKPIYAAGPGEANQEWLGVLKETGAYLAKLEGDLVAVEALSSLARIDFAAVEDVLPTLLADLAAKPSKANEVFVEIAITYYGRTRQLPQLVVILEEAISSSLISPTPRDLDACFTGPLLSIGVRAQLTRECSSSLGATQVIPLAEVLLESCKTQLEQALQRDTQEDTPKKKKRKMEKGKGVNDAQELASLRFQAVVQLLQAVLAAQPVMTGENGKLVEMADALLQRGLAGMDDLHNTGLARQRIAACCLQLHSALQILPGLAVPYSANTPLEALGLVQSIAHDSSALLRLELIRNQLRSNVTGPSIYTLLDILLQSIRLGQGDWAGYTHKLSNASLGVAVWHLISQQYLPMFESHANDMQRSELAKLILEHASTAESSTRATTISLSTITQCMLHSADFYEMPRLRDAIVEQLRSTASAGVLARYLSTLVILPDAYLDRTLKRKPVTDVQASGQQGDLVNYFLLKATKDDQAAPLINNIEFLASLANNSQSSSHAEKLFEQLWRLSLRSCQSSPEKLDQLSTFIGSLKLSSVPQAIESRRFSTYLTALTQMVEEVKVNHLSNSLKETLSSHASGLMDIAATLLEQHEVDPTLCLSACNTAQLLSDWLGQAGTQATCIPILRKSLTKILQAPEQMSSPCCLAWLELASRNLSREGLSFEAMIVSLLTLLQNCDMRDNKRFEQILTRVTLKQDEDSYRNALSVLEEALTEQTSLSTALTLCSVLICNPPDSCTRIATQAFSTLLRINSSLDLASLPAASTQAVTNFMKKVCEQRISILELHDVSAIWTIVSIMTAPAQARPETSDLLASSIYMDIINTTSFITTHRRDHLIPTFPQFCAVVSNLIHLLQISGYQTSKKRDTPLFPGWAVTSRSWIDARHTKATTRLLVSLGTKTTVLQRSRKRDASGNDRDNTSVSLVGALSKHAPFILVSFLRASTDSTAPLSSEVRKELTVGILELLSTMSKHEREALMRGFMGQSMEAERTLLRTLWKEYDRVRYKGD